MHVEFRWSWPALAVAALIAGCGGGGGGGGGLPLIVPPPAPAPAPAPSPAPAPALKGSTTLPGAEVTAFCARGPVASATADQDGHWSLSLEEQALPCLVRATAASGMTLKAGGDAAPPPPDALYTVATDAKKEAAINPLTDLLVTLAAGQSPTAWLELHQGSLAQALAELGEALPAAATELKTLLTAAGYELEGNLADAFDADAATRFDAFFAALEVSLSNAGMGYAQFAEALGDPDASPTALPFTRTWTHADVEAMPQLNQASLSIAQGVLSMTTGSGPAAPVGAFVGGGTGNKAVLQLPGFDGLKVRDFKNIKIEMQPDPGYVHTQYLPYIAFDFVIDTQCGQPPLGADASIADARVRYRTVTYDTYYQFLSPGGQHYGELTPGQFSTVVITPQTPGWRSSPGTPIGGTDVSGSETGGTPLDVDALPAEACFADAAPADGGMFRDKEALPACDTAAGLGTTAPAACGAPYRGAYLFLGSSSNQASSTWQVRSLQYNDGMRTFAFE